MWRGLLGILGLVVVGLTVADDLWVTTSVGRSGNFSVARGLSRAAWRVLHWSPRASHRRLRTAAGTVIVTAVIVGWAAGIWAGWSLVFLSSEWPVVDSTTHAPAGPWARVYFAGSSA